MQPQNVHRYTQKSFKDCTHLLFVLDLPEMTYFQDKGVKATFTRNQKHTVDAHQIHLYIKPYYWKWLVKIKNISEFC